MTNGDARPNPAVTLGNALALVFRGIEVAEDGLLRNPSPDEERKLNETLTKLRARRAIINATLNSLANDPAAVAGPTNEQVAEVSRLTGQVEDLTRASVTASAAVALSARVLVVATDIVSGAGMPGAGAGGNPPKA